MPLDPQELIHGYLDGTLDEEQVGTLGAWLSHNPDHAQQFARTALLHDALRNQFRARAELADSENPRPASPREKRNPSRWKRGVILASAAVAVIVMVVLIQGFRGDSAHAAEAELNRLIQIADKIVDRCYRITALDDGDPQRASEVDRAKRGGQPQPPIDGAILHTRGPGQYVLIRRFADGSEFITGSDGTKSWSCPPARDGKQGHVRVSNDPLRFRGPVPGQQHNIPFLDIRSNLNQLREAYELTVLPSKPGPAGVEWLGIRAERRERATGGPRDVEIWYATETGVIHQMRFDGMPQAKGGPRSLLVELIDQRDLGQNFFDHSAHHGPERRTTSDD